MSEKDDLKSPSAVNALEIIDPRGVHDLFVDWIVTIGAFEDVVNLTLASVDYGVRKSSEKVDRTVVAARLRFSKPFAARLHAALGNVLGLNAGEQAASPPKNMIN